MDLGRMDLGRKDGFGEDGFARGKERQGFGSTEDGFGKDGFEDGFEEVIEELEGKNFKALVLRRMNLGRMNLLEGKNVKALVLLSLHQFEEDGFGEGISVDAETLCQIEEVG